MKLNLESNLTSSLVFKEFLSGSYFRGGQVCLWHPDTEATLLLWPSRDVLTFRVRKHERNRNKNRSDVCTFFWEKGNWHRGYCKKMTIKPCCYGCFYWLSIVPPKRTNSLWPIIWFSWVNLSEWGTVIVTAEKEEVRWQTTSPYGGTLGWTGGLTKHRTFTWETSVCFPCETDTQFCFFNPWPFCNLCHVFIIVTMTAKDLSTYLNPKPWSFLHHTVPSSLSVWLFHPDITVPICKRHLLLAGAYGLYAREETRNLCGCQDLRTPQGLFLHLPAHPVWN